MRDPVSPHLCQCLILSLFFYVSHSDKRVVISFHYRSLEFFLCSLVPPLVLCLVNSNCINLFLWTPNLSSQLSVIDRLCLGSFSLLHMAQKLQGVSPFCLFPISQWSLSCIACLPMSWKSVFLYNLFIFIGVSGKFQLLLFHLDCKWKSIF